MVILHTHTNTHTHLSMLLLLYMDDMVVCVYIYCVVMVSTTVIYDMSVLDCLCSLATVVSDSVIELVSQSAAVAAATMYTLTPPYMIL